MDADRSEARLLALADSIASGTPVDWDNVEAADADEAELLRSLRLIDQVAQVHAKVATDADETGPAGQSEPNRDTHPGTLAPPDDSRARRPRRVRRCVPREGYIARIGWLR